MLITGFSKWIFRSLGGVLACCLVVVFANAASAATVTNTPESSWTPFKACSGSSANCASVRAITRIPGSSRVVMAGDFGSMRGPGGGSLSRDKLAVIDEADGGQVDPVFQAHTFNGTIYTLETDGSVIWALGAFTKVDGMVAGHVARFDAVTGQKLSMTSGITGNVFASELANGKLYIGGNFRRVQSSSDNRTNLAALDAATGALDPSWTPTAEMVPVDGTANGPAHNKVAARDIEATEDGGRLYVSGDFDTFNGVTNTSAIAAVNADDGAIASGWSPDRAEFAQSKGFQGMQIAVVNSSTGFAEGVILAAGGTTNRAWRLNPDGGVRWRVHTDGDVQAAAFSGGTVYLGGHFICVSTSNCYDSSTSGDAERTHVAAFPYVPPTGSTNPPADPTWSPSLGPTFSPYFYGVWTLQVFNGSLYAGGVFNQVYNDGTTYKQPKFAKFPAL